MGGYTQYLEIKLHLDTVQMINGKNGSISLGQPLPYQIAYAGGIVVNNRIYLFGGGVNRSYRINKWMYLDLIIKLSFDINFAA